MLCITHKGQPVEWCVTDREDQDVIKLFLEKIKEQSPESHVSVIMTDDSVYNNTIISTTLEIVFILITIILSDEYTQS